MKKPTRTNQSANDAAFEKMSRSYYQPKKSLKETAKEPEIDVSQKKSSRKVNVKGALLTFAIVAILSLLGILVWNMINFSSASNKLFGTPNVLGMFPFSRLDKTSANRVNVLMVGYSADDNGHAGAELTDSILILSFNTSNNTGYMLSIPRDMYVDIPEYGMAKINEAYQTGERSGFSDPLYPNGGMGLLRKTITDSFGIELHYHALVNYAAVRDTVDALGGVTVDIKSSDERGLYDPNFQPHEGGSLKLPNGPQVIDGETALKLTRARGANGDSYGFAESDFARTKHQQMVVSAIANELSWTLLLDPRANGKIFSAIGNNVETDIELPEVIPLTRLFLRVPTEELRSVSLRDINGVNLLTGYRTPTGQSALIPSAGIYDYSQIQSAIEKLE